MNSNNSMKDKKILVVGLGKSGVAAMENALRLEAEVSVQDSKSYDMIDESLLSSLEGNKVRAWLGRLPDDMGEYDMLILSPGVPVNQPFIEEAKACGAEIIGELEFAYRIGKGHFIGITGTNGKTTTTTLVGEIFREAGRDTSVVGNIGDPVINSACKANDDSWLVTEVSSFQLETVSEFRPEISAILNLTPDHLDRHGNMENYGAAKAMIFACQSADQYCVVNNDDDAVMKLVEKCPATVVPFSRTEELDFGAFVKEGRITIRDGKAETDLCGADELQIPGTHNLENALAAAAIAWFSGVDEKALAKALREFAGVEHRIEKCGEINGVRFVNDSKGTNTDAAIKAIEAMKENIILIAGGYDKQADFTKFIASFPGRVKHMMLLGATAEKIKEAALKQGFENIQMCKDMSDCVNRAWQVAEPGDVVLLSPACASWDMYKSYEKRGEDFKRCVQGLQL